ncbi:MAG TPA: trypsin-like peptidase domain-containing protein [Streptosporangiaceae bacterium]
MTFTEDDLRAALTEHGRSAPVPHDLAAVAERRGRTVRRRRRVAGVAAVLACAGAAAAIGSQADLGRRGDRDTLSPATYPSISPQVAAKQSVVQITAAAPGCARTLKGTGFVYSRERVITAAHGLAGTRSVDVRTLGGPAYRARVVEYDPRRDVAVLFVPGLPAPGLRFAATARSGDRVVVAGFGRGRPPLWKVPGRIESRHRATGLDLYHTTQVTREVYTVHARVEPGMAGGPLIAADGSAYGLVFAAALDAPDIGYALTANEIAPVAQHGRTATKSVPTQTCTD